MLSRVLPLGTRLMLLDPDRAGAMGVKSPGALRIARHLPHTVWWTDREDGELVDFVSTDVFWETFIPMPALEDHMLYRDGHGRSVRIMGQVKQEPGSKGTPREGWCWSLAGNWYERATGLFLFYDERKSDWYTLPGHTLNILRLA